MRKVPDNTCSLHSEIIRLYFTMFVGVMMTLVIFVAFNCLICIIYYERILLYKVRKQLKRKDVNLCVFFKL